MPYVFIQGTIKLYGLMVKMCQSGFHMNLEKTCVIALLIWYIEIEIVVCLWYRYIYSRATYSLRLTLPKYVISKEFRK